MSQNKFLLAKKLMAAVSSPKSPEPESLGKEEMKPKRSKRKLYSTDISCPLDIPASWVSNYTLLLLYITSNVMHFCSLSLT